MESKGLYQLARSLILVGINLCISACSLARLGESDIMHINLLARSFSQEYVGVYQLARSLAQSS